MDYQRFFETATGHPPFDWQGRLANGEGYEARNPSTHTGVPCQSHLIDIPTGLGKTAGVVLAWLWNRLGNGPVPPNQSPRSSTQRLDHSTTWPRRLVYCLPMRTLVEQTAGEVEKWLVNLWNARDQLDENATTELAWLCGFDPEKPDSFTDLPTPPLNDSTTQLPNNPRSPVILMGGEEQTPAKRDWDLYPEKPCILIGTQDMLLSRALNRGYGAGRARWPMSFALLNNDALWLKDEVQLMANGLSTSLQLQAWRESLGTKDTPDSITTTEKPSTVLPTHTWWMSATMAEHWFQTAVDWRSIHLDETTLAPDKLWRERLKIGDADKNTSGLFHIEKTKKKIDPKSITPLEAKGRTVDKKELKDYAESVAKFIAKEENRKGNKLHKDSAETPDLCTLVVVNTVERAVAIYNTFIAAAKSASQAKPSTRYPFDQYNLLLLHSRFRGHERKQWPALIKTFEQGENTKVGNTDYTLTGPRLIIATQVIEAGVDLSVPILYTEHCPMASLVQRLGRCARRAGETGKVYILPMSVDETTAKPYTKAELEAWQP